jgi:hypothetical protein
MSKALRSTFESVFTPKEAALRNFFKLAAHRETRRLGEEWNSADSASQNASMPLIAFRTRRCEGSHASFKNDHRSLVRMAEPYSGRNV